MRNFSPLLSLLALASTAAAQAVTLPAIFATAEGGTTGNVWRAGTNRVQCFYDSSNFVSQGVLLPITITSVDFRLGGGITPGNIVTYPSVEIYLQNSAVDFQTPSTTFASNRTVAFPTAPNFSGPVTTLAGVGTTPNNFFINVPLATPFVYDPSAGVDLLMEIVILVAPAPVLGSTISAGYSNPAHLCNSIRSVGSTTALTGAASPFAPVAQFTYAPVPGAAYNVAAGQGCIRYPASFYENFATSVGFDLSNTSLTFLPTGGGYVVTSGGGTFLPVGSIGTPTTLALVDDSEVNVPFTIGSFPGWTGLQICSNGFISQAAGNGTVAGGAPAALLGNPQTAFYCWHDFDPATTPGTGAVKVEESAAVTTVTWDAVYDFGTSTPNTMQFQFHSSGIVNIVWQTMSNDPLANGFCVGYSPGGANSDPGATDISAMGSNPIVLAATDTDPLTLGWTSRPITGGSWDLAVTNIPAGGVLGIDIFGLADPGVNDLAFLGMPGCGLRATLDAMNVYFPAGSSHAYSLAIPANPALVGQSVYTTSAMFVVPSPNAFGAITANGVQGVMGSL